MNQKILITGGSGLLGSYLIRWFRQLGYTNITATYHHSKTSIPDDIGDGIVWLPLELPDKVACYEITAGQDWVIHTAGYVSYHPHEKYKLLDINKTGTEHLANASLYHNVAHFVYIGSIGALGRETNHVTLNENSPWLENEWSTSYGLSKYLGELDVWRAAAEGLNASVILPSVILGTGDWGRSSLQMITRIVSDSGFYPTGQTGFVDVRDICFFVSQLLAKSLSGDRWLLNGKDMGYGEMYRLVARHMGLEKTYRPAPRWLASVKLMSRNIFTKKGLGQEVLRHAYGTFSFDASKSLSVEGFRYRDIDDSIRDIADLFRQGVDALPLRLV